MNTKKYFFDIRKLTGVLVFLLLSFASCKDDSQLGMPSRKGSPPPPPSLVGVVNMSGAAIINFSVPANDDIIGVVATYDINGVERSVKASVFENKLKVEGFGRAADFKVYLKSFDRYRNESEPIEVTVSPLTPPVHLIFGSLEVLPTFNGLRVIWENAEQNNIIVSVSAKDELGEWYNLENFYSNSKEGRGLVRGLPTDSITVSVSIRDRWDNYSDVLITKLLPWYDEPLDRTKFKEVTRLPGDGDYMASPRTPSQIWTPVTGEPGLPGVDAAYHSSTIGIGYCVTFDMGQVAILSTYKWYDRLGSTNNFVFTHNNLRRYTIYGSMDLTLEMQASGSLDLWTKLYEAVAFRPSGGGIGAPNTSDDLAYAAEGDFHEMPPGTPPVRYIRILFQENWSNGTLAQIRAIRFRGQIQK